jgi:hypothetical protein
MSWVLDNLVVHRRLRRIGGFNPRSICLPFVFVMLFNLSAAAQQRPLVTEDPRIIPDGSIVSELGAGYFSRARFPVSGLEGNQISFLANGLHVGLGPRAEFQIAGVLHNFVRLTESGAGWRNDWGDFSLSTKIMLIGETSSRPVISFRPTIVLPNTNNEKGLGTDGTHFFGSLLAGKSLGPLFLFGNFGLGILDDAVRPAAQQDVLSYGVAAILPISSRLSLASEWSGLENPQENPSPGGEDHGQIRLGFQVRAWGVRWDIGSTAGLTRLDPRVGFVFGATKEFQLWK